jgi:hypothetical protein
MFVEKISLKISKQIINNWRVNNLHASSLPIKATKYKHLQELKSVIPRDYHHFFDGLPHCWKTMGLCWLQTFISEKLHCKFIPDFTWRAIHKSSYIDDHIISHSIARSDRIVIFQIWIVLKEIMSQIFHSYGFELLQRYQWTVA